MKRVRIKICCIASPEEAALAIECGADALGLVARMPSGPGPIEDDLIAKIARRVPPPIATFLLTCETDCDAITDHVRRCGVNTVQLVDRVDPSIYPKLRQRMPGVRLVQVIHVEGPDALETMRAMHPRPDAILLDSGRPNAAVRVLGGTGIAHDWSISRALIAECDVPVFLAGGLRAENILSAIAYTSCYGVDLCTGVRTDYQLDPDKLRKFMATVRGGHGA